MGLLLCVRHGFVLRSCICLPGWSSRYDTVSFVISRLGSFGIVLASGARDESGSSWLLARSMSLFHLDCVGMRLLISVRHQYGSNRMRPV
jgi:hypothetical protein